MHTNAVPTISIQTNESMTNCIYAKSLCSEEGQIVYTEDSSKNDKTCRCDYRRNYSFTKTPKHVCYCIPTEEDCSCYIKACQLNFTLSTVIGAIGAFFVATENLHQIPFTVSYTAPKWLRRKLQSSERCIGGCQTDTDETDIRRTVKTSETDASYKSTTYDQTNGNTVTSDDLDITIVIHLLVTLTNIEVGDLYPVQSDERISAMLSRIKYIRNELAQSYEGTLSGDKFNKYWDDIAQVMSRPMLLANCQFKTNKDEQDCDTSKQCELSNITIETDRIYIFLSLFDNLSYFGVVSVKDDLTFKRIQIPKDFYLPNRTRHFKDLTDEEINFLLVVYGLTKIVYPAIKDEFDTKCPDHELEKIRMEIYEQQRTVGIKDSHSDKKKNIYLTQKQQEQLLSPKAVVHIGGKEYDEKFANLPDITNSLGQ
ncbi:unnamed protein product [Mytilus edulis]|uniref:DZIP3-like HEPN domain-containing protein n=1 Tax=Mytilus edulis TaxID=6550 RepID=A0A8S3QJE6_MYTED|nr:unnamed protein product [Mytilus edulis]